jgi:hypothetical protein
MMRCAKPTLLVAVCLLALLAGCASTSKLGTSQSAVRSYNGTASVGDFLTITIDATAQTITYKNYTNGDAGTVPYTVKSDGTYAITDPNGNLLAAYEVPGFVLMVETAKSGPSHNTVALITAIENTPASISTFAGRNFNYVQFRTAAGGIELGAITIDAGGNIQHAGYWPYEVFSQPPRFFGSGSFPASSVHEDSSGDFFTVTESDGSQDYVFGTQSGFFAVDTGNGTILSLPRAATKTFDATTAGTYTAIYYKKADAQTGQGNIETGTSTEGKATVTISANGLMTITDNQNNNLASGTLAAVADTPYLYDGTSNTLSDPLFGTFTFRMATGGVQQDMFVSLPEQCGHLFQLRIIMAWG